MSDPSNPLRLEVVGVLRNGRRRYDPTSKQRLVEACLQPGVSLAGLALEHGVNANLLRKWVAEHQRQQRNGVAEGAIECATEVFVPVVELCGVAGPPEPPVPPPIQPLVHRTKVARQPDPPAPRLTVEMPNGVTLRLECRGHDVELVSAMIETLGRCDVSTGR
jgi:transposase